MDMNSARLIAKSLSASEKTALFKERAESSGAKVHMVEQAEHLRERLEEILPDGARLAVAGARELESKLGPAHSWIPDSCECIDFESNSRSESNGEPNPDDRPKSNSESKPKNDSESNGESKSERIRASLFEIDAALTRVEAAVAETGSIVLEAGPEHARLLSLTAEKHIAIVWPDQIVPDLLDWSHSISGTTTAELAGSSDGHAGDGPAHGFTLISGPSKTADIELQLVTGVHGPGALHLLVIDF